MIQKLNDRIIFREWLTTSAPTLDQKTAPPGAQLRYDRQPYDEVDHVDDLKHLDDHCNPLMTTLPRSTRPARWWGTHGRTARRVALAPTSSATRASSSTSRASASTEPKLQESSAELVTPAQNSQITFQFMWLFSRGIPRCDPGQCPIWDEPEAGSSLPCRQVRTSDEGAPPQNVSRCLLF